MNRNKNSVFILVIKFSTMLYAIKVGMV